ncbi:MAG: LysR substrate-binding domain-containing protein [Bacteroidota bacterium]
MTLTQLRYLVALGRFQNFVQAAEYCHVSQSTLSMQVKKLEESLDVLIFDRSKKPVQLTPIGQQIVAQAQVGLSEIERIRTIIKMDRQKIADELSIGIIPTLSPYLLPLFLVAFTRKNPTVKIRVRELLTEQIIHELRNNDLDIGIIATPEEESNFSTLPLFREAFVAYVSESHPLYHRRQLRRHDLTGEDLWLLEKGHCFRGQVLNVCEDERLRNAENAIQFESGSLETLRRIVDSQHGYTLLPELAVLGFREAQRGKIRRFVNPVPAREVRMLLHHSYASRATVALLRAEIVANLPEAMRQRQEELRIIDWRRE